MQVTSNIANLANEPSINNEIMRRPSTDHMAELSTRQTKETRQNRQKDLILNVEPN